MLKTLKVAALVCGLFIMHGQQAHAAWQLMFGNDSIPPNAVTTLVNGYLYPCRASFEGGMHPGWTAPGKNACAFSWGGLEHDSTEYEIWVEDWEPATNGNVPPNAIPLGYEKIRGTGVPVARYACQAPDPSYQSWNAGYRVASGRVAPDLGGCDYPWGGAEQHATSYNVLVDSAITMVDSTGGPKLVVSLATLGYPTFIGTYQLLGWSNNPIDEGTVRSGFDDDGEPLFFCTAVYNGNLFPGKVRNGFGGCDISYGGREIPNINGYLELIQNWQTLPGWNYRGGQIPIDQQLQAPTAAYPGGLYQSAVIGGHEADGSNLYLCAGWVSQLPGTIGDTAYMPGKFSKALGTCSVALNGKEVLTPGYAFLVETYTKPVH